MDETKKTGDKTEMKHESHEHKHEHASEHKHDEKKETVVQKPKVKKENAVARGNSLHISKRHGMYLCSFIKGKSIDSAIDDMEKVILLKKAIPFKGEIPHRKGKGMMSGRYPTNAAKIFIPILKSLRGNATVNGMDLSKTIIASASTNLAPRPARRGGTHAKRAHVIIEAKEINKLEK
ncbi:MAG: uL22 family ribosomal protein [Nanoarchaeota archaeon]